MKSFDLSQRLSPQESQKLLTLILLGFHEEEAIQKELNELILGDANLKKKESKWVAIEPLVNGLHNEWSIPLKSDCYGKKSKQQRGWLGWAKQWDSTIDDAHYGIIMGRLWDVVASQMDELKKEGGDEVEWKLKIIFAEYLKGEQSLGSYVQALQQQWLRSQNKEMESSSPKRENLSIEDWFAVLDQQSIRRQVQAIWAHSQDKWENILQVLLQKPFEPWMERMLAPIQKDNKTIWAMNDHIDDYPQSRAMNWSTMNWSTWCHSHVLKNQESLAMSVEDALQYLYQAQAVKRHELWYWNKNIQSEREPHPDFKNQLWKKSAHPIVSRLLNRYVQVMEEGWGKSEGSTVKKKSTSSDEKVRAYAILQGLHHLLGTVDYGGEGNRIFNASFTLDERFAWMPQNNHSKASASMWRPDKVWLRNIVNTLLQRPSRENIPVEMMHETFHPQCIRAIEQEARHAEKNPEAQWVWSLVQPIWNTTQTKMIWSCDYKNLVDRITQAKEEKGLTAWDRQAVMVDWIEAQRKSYHDFLKQQEDNKETSKKSKIMESSVGSVTPVVDSISTGIPYVMAVGSALNVALDGKPIQHILGDIKQEMKNQGGVQAGVWKTLLKQPRIAQVWAMSMIGAVQINKWMKENEGVWTQAQKDYESQIFREKDQSCVEEEQPDTENHAQKNIPVLKMEWMNDVLKLSAEQNWSEEATVHILKVGNHWKWALVWNQLGEYLVNQEWGGLNSQDKWVRQQTGENLIHHFKAYTRLADIKDVQGVTVEQRQEEWWQRTMDEIQRETQEVNRINTKGQELLKKMMSEWARREAKSSVIEKEWAEIKDLANEFKGMWGELDRKNPLGHALNWHQEWINSKDVITFLKSNAKSDRQWEGIFQRESLEILGEDRAKDLKNSRVEQEKKWSEKCKLGLLSVEQKKEWTRYIENRMERELRDSMAVSIQDPKGKEDERRGVSICELVSDQDLKFEGTTMRHCVSGESFIEKGVRGQARFFHLKDEKTQEETTLMLVHQGGEWMVEQHKGVYNANVKSKKLRQIESVLSEKCQRHDQKLMEQNRPDFKR